LSVQRRRNQVTIAAVTFLLGILVIVQLRAQTEGSPLAQLSSQDLTVLVANLNGRNDQLRREVATLERDLASLTEDEARGEISIDDLRAELERVRAYAGLSAVVGSGVVVTISGPIDGGGLRGGRCWRSCVARRLAAWGDGGHGSDRGARQADRIADPVRRGHRATGRDATAGHRHRHADGPPRTAGDRARLGPDPWATSPLIG
jgi:hypothetical protein